jgi:hypothetical protein
MAVMYLFRKNGKKSFRLGLMLTILLLLLSVSIPVSAAGTGAFNVGAFEQPQAKPVDYNTNAHWANIAAAKIDRMMSIENSGGLTYNKAENENGIANSYANGVKLYVTDSNIYGFESYTAADYATLESRLTPYKNDSRVSAINFKDEPFGYNLEGYANTFKRASTFAPALQYYVNLQPALNEYALHNPPGKLALSNSGASGNGSYVTSGNSVGQTIKIPAGMTLLHGIQLNLDAGQFSSSETLTLKLWNSTAKTSLLGQASITGSGAGEIWKNYTYFAVNAAVTAGTIYYMELTHNGGGNNTVGWVTRSSTSVYTDGVAYESGVSKAYDFWFRLYSLRPNTPIIFNDIAGSPDGDYVSTTKRLGQTFTTPANVNRRIYYVQTQIDATQWSNGQLLTLTLWDSPSRTNKIASGALYSSNNGNYPVFYLNAKVSSSTSYYWELTSNSATQVGWVVKSVNSSYSGGAGYLNGSPYGSGSDFWFKAVFGSEYENYLDDWLDMSGLNELHYDNYPFRATDDDPAYFLNMEYIRERGLDHNVIYGAF